MFKLNSICQFLHYYTTASLIISNISFITVTSAAIDDHFEGCKPSYYSSSTTQNVGNGQIGLPEDKITNSYDEIDGSPIQNAASENKPSKMTTTAESIVPEGQYENGQPTDETCQLPFEYPGRTCSANCAERSDCISVAGMFVPQYTRLNCFCHTNYTLTTASSEAYCLNNIWFSEIPECVPTEEFKPIEPIKPIDVEVSTKTPLKTSSIESLQPTSVMCRFPTRVHGRTCSVSCPRQQSTVKCSSTPNSYIDQYAVLSCVCNDGYTLASGSSTAYCISGKWFMEEPYCSACDRYVQLICPTPTKSSTSVNLIGGQEAVGGEYPHMALIGLGERNNKIWSCGGSLISKKFVLSAAHCASSYRLYVCGGCDNYESGPARWVRLGELDYEKSTDKSKPTDYEIINRIVHPDYRSSSRYNDIALFELDRTVSFNKYIFPICLQTNPNLEGELIATGWGQTDVGSPVSSALRTVQLNYIPTQTCDNIYGRSAKYERGIDNATMFCAGDLKGGKDTCTGDSGGPLQRKFNKCFYEQIGITSFGQSCGQTETAGVYTKISYYIPWIESVVQKN